MNLETTMQDEQRSQYLNRGSILNLLSDEEIAQVSRADSAVRLAEGEEYLDLGDLEHGVRRAQGAAMSMRRVLPRKAVHAATWSDILAQLALLRVAAVTRDARALVEAAAARRSAELSRPGEAEGALEQLVHAGDEQRVAEQTSA
jgi:hypothetical protein